MRASAHARPVLAGLVAIIVVAASSAGCGGRAEPRPQWVTSTEGTITSDPSAAGDALYVEAGRGLYALAMSNGTIRWRQRLVTAGRDFHPVTAGQLVSVAGDHVDAYDAATGAHRWRWPLPQGVLAIGDLGAAGGKLYVAGDGTRRIDVLDGQTGAELAALDVAIAGTFDGASVIVSGGQIIVYVLQDGRLYAFDAGTGSLRWSVATPGGNASDPVLSDGAVYLATTAGTVHSIDATTGVERWTSHLSGGASFVSRPTIAGGRVFVGFADHHLHALTASTGTRLWSATAPDSIEGSPAVASGIVYAGADDGGLYAFDAATGTPKGAVHPGVVGTAPVVRGGVVYAATLDGRVYAYDVRSFR